MVEKTLALAVTGLIIFFIANFFPFLGFRIDDRVRETFLFTGMFELYANGMWLLASIVLVTVIFTPFFILSGLCFVLIPVHFNLHPWHTKTVLKCIQKIQPWVMIEIFMLGILVSLVKLSDMAVIIPGTALYAFMALIFITTAALNIFNPQEVWIILEKTR